MCLHWVSLTCAQVGLKHNSSEASPNSLISDLWAIAQWKGLRPNNAKSPHTFKLATPLGSWEKDKESKKIPRKLCPQDQRQRKIWVSCHHRQSQGQPRLTSLIKQKVLMECGLGHNNNEEISLTILTSLLRCCSQYSIPSSNWWRRFGS